MIFITLSKFRKPATKKVIAESDKHLNKFTEEGCKMLGIYWTLGKYDAVGIWQAKNEKTAMKTLLRFSDTDSTETLIAVPRKEAVKLLEK